MYRDQSALIREGSADLPAGENGAVPHHVTAGGLVCICCCVRAFPVVEVPNPNKRVVCVYQSVAC